MLSSLFWLLYFEFKTAKCFQICFWLLVEESQRTKEPSSKTVGEKKGRFENYWHIVPVNRQIVDIIDISNILTLKIRRIKTDK